MITDGPHMIKSNNQQQEIARICDLRGQVETLHDNVWLLHQVQHAPVLLVPSSGASVVQFPNLGMAWLPTSSDIKYLLAFDMLLD